MTGRTLTRREMLAMDGPPEGEADHWIRVHRAAMACRFEIVLSGEAAAFVPAARQSLAELDAIEAELTVFRDTSELARVNREAPAAAVATTPMVFALLELCRELHAATGGAFDPTSTPLSRAWGFLARDGRLPEPDEIATARARVGMDGVTLDPGSRAVRFARPGLELNLGAVGKGYALGVMAARLRAAGARHALLSASGSSVVALGGGAEGWPVTLRPSGWDGGPIAHMRLREIAMGTTGAGEQFVEVDGRRYGHVIDPRTGWPAEGLRSATVMCADAASADALSTAFFVGGPALAERFCATHPQVLALLAPHDGPVQVFGACDGAAVATASS